MEYSGDPSLASLAFVACVPPRHGQGWSDPEMSKGVRPNPPVGFAGTPHPPSEAQWQIFSSGWRMLPGGLGHFTENLYSIYKVNEY